MRVWAQVPCVGSVPCWGARSAPTGLTPAGRAPCVCGALTPRVPPCTCPQLAWACLGLRGAAAGCVRAVWPRCGVCACCMACEGLSSVGACDARVQVHVGSVAMLQVHAAAGVCSAPGPHTPCMELGAARGWAAAGGLWAGGCACTQSPSSQGSVPAMRVGARVCVPLQAPWAWVHACVCVCLHAGACPAPGPGRRLRCGSAGLGLAWEGPGGWRGGFMAAAGGQGPARRGAACLPGGCSRWTAPAPLPPAGPRCCLCQGAADRWLFSPGSARLGVNLMAQSDAGWEHLPVCGRPVLPPGTFHLHFS